MYVLLNLLHLFVIALLKLEKNKTQRVNYQNVCWSKKKKN